MTHEILAKSEKEYQQLLNIEQHIDAYKMLHRLIDTNVTRIDAHGSISSFTGGKLIEKQGQINSPRNAPCNCNSGKKYKKCCGANK